MEWIEQALEETDVLLRCVGCGEIDKVKINILMQLDIMMVRDRRLPPHISCGLCGRKMVPEEYIGKNGELYYFQDYAEEMLIVD